MAFQRKQQGDNTDAAFTVRLSAKQGNKWVEGGSFSFWPNENGGPAFKGTLKEERLQSIIEFLTAALEEGLTVSMSMFDNQQQQAGKASGFKKQGGFTNAFKKSGASFGAKKASPFSRKQEEQQDGQQGDDNNGPFGNE